MTELLTAAQMRAIEQAAMDAGDITGRELMERAGQGVVEAIFEHWPEYRKRRISVAVLCGPGNNGGDGFVVTRLLQQLGRQVQVFATDTSSKCPDALANRAAWLKLGPIYPLKMDTFRERTQKTNLFVDAVFGVGLSRPVEGDLAELFHHVSGIDGDRYCDSMVAVDIPSGICADRQRRSVSSCGFDGLV